MKEINITPPEGYEIDKDKSTFEKIVFKKVEFKFPLSIIDIPNRKWYINSAGSIHELIDSPCSDSKDINSMSSSKLAHQILQLIELIELRDAWNQGWKPDFSNSKQKFQIMCFDNYIDKRNTFSVSRILTFKSSKIRSDFLDTFRSKIELVKELI